MAVEKSCLTILMRRECSEVFSDSTELGFPNHYYEIYPPISQWVKISDTMIGFANISGQRRWLLKTRGLVFILMRW